MSGKSIRDLVAAAAATTEGIGAEALELVNAGVGGLDAALGVRYTRIANGRVEAEVAVDERHLQPVGLVNGGVFSALAESTGSLAGMVAAEGRVVVGVNNNTDFISSVRGGIIHAEATPVQVGGRTQVWQVLMRNDGRLVARTTLRTMVL